MKHFFEQLERDIDFRKEYQKLEKMLVNENYTNKAYFHYSINDWIEDNFRKWEKRQNYTSFKEVRDQVGFPLTKTTSGLTFSQRLVKMEDYFLYCEMIINVLMGLSEYSMSSKMEEGTKHIINTAKATVEKAGFEIKLLDSEVMIVERNAIAIEVADFVPELADVIVEYNHYLLKGNLDKKKELLKKIADAIEPKRSILNSLNNSATDDFFWMVNKMNVRHNNCDMSDKKHYFGKFAILPLSEKEEWYDRIYEQALMLFVLLKYQERNPVIQSFKKTED